MRSARAVRCAGTMIARWIVALALILAAPGHSSSIASKGYPKSPAPAACESLKSLTLANASISIARTVGAGPFAPPSTSPESKPQTLTVSKAFCRIGASLTPSSDSEIGIEVWMPVEGWNGNFQAVGNGGFSGAINYAAMAAALARGYAAASTDTGHAGGGARWALGHPEKVIDFGWRSVHETAVVSKRIVSAFYTAGPRFSYWTGCSAGGRQGMQEAQRFPDDFDGIVAGAPGLDWTGRAGQATRVAKVLESDASARLGASQRQVLHRAVLDACDASDGAADGLLEHPPTCAFDPASLHCKGADTSACLTKPQVDTVRLMYSSPVNPASTRAIGGLVPGSELGWTDLGWTASARATGLDHFRYIVFGDPAWTVQRFDFEADIVRAESRDRNTINALDPDLRPFIRSGGKLIQYHGWSDPQISPLNSTQYYKRVIDTLGGAAQVHGAYRLFMAPGMGHCGGGEGPNTFDMLAALERWVEQGVAPDAVIASRATNGSVTRTRPLCPYPQVAAYKGAGNMNEAASFACRTP
jgi:feruloyl esterase